MESPTSKYYQSQGSRATWCPRIFKKKKKSADTLTRALTCAQVCRPQSARVEVCSHLPASQKKSFFLKIPRDQGGPGSPGSIVVVLRKSFFLPAGKSARRGQFCPPHFGGIIFCTIDHRQMETETRFCFRLSNNGNGYVFLFWRQMDMEMETCFRFIIP